MALEISQTYAKIGMETSPLKLEMQTQQARLQLHQKHAKVKLETEPVLVEISQYEAFASAGLKNNFDRARDIAQQAYQQVMEYIGKTAEDGGRFAAIEKGGNPIADIAVRDAYPVHEFGLGTIPKVGPRFNVRMGSVKIEPERNGDGVEGAYLPGRLEFNVTPSEVNIFMRQYADINIKYIPDQKIDTYR